MPGLRSWSTTHRFPRSRTSMRPRRRPTDRRRPLRRPSRSPVSIPRPDSRPGHLNRPARAGPPGGTGAWRHLQRALLQDPHRPVVETQSGYGEGVVPQGRHHRGKTSPEGEPVSESPSRGARGEPVSGTPSRWPPLGLPLRSLPFVFCLALSPFGSVRLRSVSGLGRGVGNRPCRARHRFCSLEKYGAESVRRRRGAQKRLENGPETARPARRRRACCPPRPARPRGGYARPCRGAGSCCRSFHSRESRIARTQPAPGPIQPAPCGGCAPVASRDRPTERNVRHLQA